MDQIYIEYILILTTCLTNLFQTNHFPREIIQIIVMFTYRQIEIGYGPNSSHSFIYDCKFSNIAYAFGENRSGELGIGHTNKVIGLHKLIFDEPIGSIMCGGRHTICLTSKGNIYSWGSNLHGQLGLGSNSYQYFPQKIQLSNISIINCGVYFTIAYGNNSNLYGWGYNNNGQLGLGDQCDHTDRNKPTLVSYYGKDILQISCGSYHTICLTNNNIIGWGSNFNGKLGTMSPNNHYCKPTKITFFNTIQIKIISIKCGDDHTMFLTSKKEIYVCGSNHCNQLGLDDVSKNIFIPQKLNLSGGPFSNIKEIECGAQYSAIVTTTGKLYMYGYGQISSKIIDLQQRTFQ